MALNERFALRVGGYLCLLTTILGGCRGITVCSSEACRDESLLAGGKESGGTASSTGSSGAAAGESEGGRAAAGGAAAGGAAAGEPAAAGGNGGDADEVASGPSCDGTFAECDGSSLTVCETDVTWNVRHCGGCAQDCDGICGGAQCEPAIAVAPLYVRSMVASSTTGFALAHDGSEFSILKVDIATAEGGVYLGNVSEQTHLAISGDRVYFASVIENDDEDAEDAVELRSAQLDGSGLVLEEGIEPLDIGAAAAGFYYVSKSTNEDTFEDTYRLFFRATGSTTWQALHSGARCRILASSEFGVVVGKDDDAENTELFLVTGAKQTSLGAAPPNLEELAVTSNAVVALLRDEDLDVTRMRWMRPGAEPSEYTVPTPNNGFPELNVHRDEILMFFQEHGQAHIQRFASGGPSDSRSGIAPFAHVSLVDRDYVWYAVFDTWITMRFLRSRWFQVP
jgi:hypothetical protein